MDRRVLRAAALAAVVAQAAACKPGNVVQLSLGTDMLCGQHPNGRWDCFEPAEEEFLDQEIHARRFDLPRDDYAWVSPDKGSACGIRPEDNGVECFGEDPPSPPPMQLTALRFIAPDLIFGISTEGTAVRWSEAEGIEEVSNGYDSFTANEGWYAAYRAGNVVEFPFSPSVDPTAAVVAYDVGAYLASTNAWIGTDGCFHTDGVDIRGDISATDCDGPFQPIVIGGRAGAYALDEEGTIHGLDVVDSTGYGGSCPPPKGRFQSLARWGSLTCAVKIGGGVLCWEEGGENSKAVWLSELSETYHPAGDPTTSHGNFDRCG